MREQIPAAVSTLKVKGEQMKTEMQQRKLRPSEKKLFKCMKHVIMLESSLLELADANKAILGNTASVVSIIIIKKFRYCTLGMNVLIGPSLISARESYAIRFEGIGTMPSEYSEDGNTLIIRCR